MIFRQLKSPAVCVRHKFRKEHNSRPLINGEKEMYFTSHSILLLPIYSFSQFSTKFHLKLLLVIFLGGDVQNGPTNHCYKKINPKKGEK